MPTIRPSRDEDIPAITAIYAHHVLHGTGTFETTPPTEAEMAGVPDDVRAVAREAAVADGHGGRGLKYDNASHVAQNGGS